MLARIAFWIVAAIAVFLPLWGQAQTCTLGPYCSATCTGGSVQTLSQISTAINNAVGGDVACLQRGQTWSEASSLALTHSFSGTRVTVCASTGAACSDTGAANPRISTTGTCASITGGGGGYNISNLDCFNTSNTNLVKAWGIDHSSHDITIAGGVIDSYWQGAYFDGGSGADVDNFKWGTCGHLVEIRGDASISNPSQLRSVSWGALTNSSISLWVHDFNAPTANVAQSHWIDLAQNGNLSPTTSSHDVTFECGLYQMNSTSAGVSGIKVNRGYHIVFRDNIFQAMTPGAPAAIAFADHAAGGTEGIDGSGVNCAGAEIYRNLFLGGSGIWDELAADVCIYNNVGDWTTATSGTNGLVVFHFESGASDDLPISNVRIYNNTVYKNSGVETFPVLLRDNPGTPSRTLPTNLWLFNNLSMDLTASAQNAAVFGSNCARWGTNGANIKSNFVYTPNDSTPDLWSGCSAASGNSGSPYNTAPGVANAGADNFAVTGASAVCTFTAAAGTPATDFTTGTRTDDCIGAYDVTTGGPPSETPQPRGAPSGRFTMGQLDDLLRSLLPDPRIRLPTWARDREPASYVLRSTAQ